MKTLTLSLKRKWFDMIKSGVKKEEYREIGMFWSVRFLDILKKRKAARITKKRGSTYLVTVHAEQRHVEVHPRCKRKLVSRMFHSTPRNAEDIWAEVYEKC